jgi:hypothetical protein
VAGINAIQNAPVSELTSGDLEDLKELIKHAIAERETLNASILETRAELKRARARLHRAEHWFLGLFLRSKVPERKAVVEAKSEELAAQKERLDQAIIEADFALDGPTRAAFEEVSRAFEAVAKCTKIWDITGAYATDRKQTRSAATCSVERKPVDFSVSDDPVLQTDGKVLQLKTANGADMLLYPGFALILTKNDLALIDLREIEITYTARRFVETESLPADAAVVDHAWAKCNKDGSPDRRFAGNYQIPVALYGEVTLISKSGLHKEYQFSRAETAERFGESLTRLQSSLRLLGEGGSQRASDPGHRGGRIFSKADKGAIEQSALRLGEVINESLELSNGSHVPATKLTRLDLAKRKLEELKELAAEYPFIDLPNLDKVAACIAHLEVEFEQAGYRKKSKGTIDGPQPGMRLNPDIGSTEPSCPYCSHRLAKMPGRKKKCPECGKHMLVRTRPSDRMKVLIREDQALDIEEQWSIANGTHDQFIAGRAALNAERDALRKELGREPSVNEIKWTQLKKHLGEHRQAHQWGLYRNDRLSMADILKSEGRYDRALAAYLEVCYLDLNGPNNCSSSNPEILRQFPPFVPKDASLAPGVVGLVAEMLEREQTSVEEARGRFLEVAAKAHRALNLPVTPQEAWAKLSRELD